jgi:hypothetical protein
VDGSIEDLSVHSLAELRAHADKKIRHVCIREELTSVPQEILEFAPNVEVLDLSANRLCSVPEWIGELSKLKVLFLSNNCFTEVPRTVRACRRLRMLGIRANQIEHVAEDALPQSLQWLTLTDNLIQALPENLGGLKSLQKLLLAGNRLSHLPDSLRGASKLELLRISANAFERFPEWLFELPSLAWLAIAGNPCSALPDSALDEVYSVPWNELQLMEQLGRGASGHTFRARHVPNHSPEREVAVKVFAANVSSDGNARDEIAAALRAGRHPNLVSTCASFSQHPEGRMGLILDVVPSGFRNLAAPPSFDSCTRDVYPTDFTISYAQAVQYVADIARATAHLHQNGILHGDLYAHNTLVSDDAALVSDFGAACVYAESPGLNRDLLERIEVRSFGILVAELIQRVHASEQAHVGHLRLLAEQCMAPAVAQRPTFAQTLQAL